MVSPSYPCRLKEKNVCDGLLEHLKDLWLALSPHRNKPRPVLGLQTLHIVVLFLTIKNMQKVQKMTLNNTEPSIFTYFFFKSDYLFMFTKDKI